MTSAQVNSLQLQSDGDTLYNGSTIFYMLREYSARYMICDSVENFLFKWSAYNGYKLPDFIRAYNALYAEYNPLNNYDMTEKSVDMENDGDVTRTRNITKSLQQMAMTTVQIQQQTALTNQQWKITRQHTTTRQQVVLLLTVSIKVKQHSIRQQTQKTTYRKLLTI